MIIEKGTIDKLDDCRGCLTSCLLGEKYFYDPQHTLNFLTEGFSEGEIYIAKNCDGETIGFMRIDLTGAFARFPLIRVIAVKAGLRNQGIGTRMMKFFEELGFQNFDKLFLLVSEFNHDAKQLYERLGYVQVGYIPDLYQKGIAEYLMMKKKA